MGSERSVDPGESAASRAAPGQHGPVTAAPALRDVGIEPLNHLNEDER